MWFFHFQKCIMQWPIVCTTRIATVQKTILRTVPHRRPVSDGEWSTTDTLQLPNDLDSHRVRHSSLDQERSGLISPATSSSSFSRSLNGSFPAASPGPLSPEQSANLVHNLPPELLNIGWRRFWSQREGREYFYNKFTQESLWEMPVLQNHVVFS